MTANRSQYLAAFEVGVCQMRRAGRCWTVDLVERAMMFSSYFARRRRISSVDPKNWVGWMRKAAPVGQACTQAWLL